MIFQLHSEILWFERFFKNLYGLVVRFGFFFIPKRFFSYFGKDYRVPKHICNAQWLPQPMKMNLFQLVNWKLEALNFKDCMWINHITLIHTDRFSLCNSFQLVWPITYCTLILAHFEEKFATMTTFISRIISSSSSS